MKFHPRPSRTTANKQQVTNAMMKGATTAAEVAKATGLSIPTAHKYMQQLVDDGAARITNADAPRKFAQGRNGKPAHIFEWLLENQPKANWAAALFC